MKHKEAKQHGVDYIIQHYEEFERGTRGYGGILMSFLGKILLEMKFNSNFFEFLLAEYVTRENKKLADSIATDNKPRKHFTKGNLRRELLNGEKMTFRSFMRGMRILGAVKVVFRLEIHRTDRVSGIEVTNHEYTVKLDEFDDSPGEDDDDERSDVGRLGFQDVTDQLLRMQQPDASRELDANWKPPVINRAGPVVR